MRKLQKKSNIWLAFEKIHICESEAQLYKKADYC